MERGLSHMLERHTKLGLPMFDVENIITQANKENSNTTHNPESINLTIAETVLKQYALQRVFSEDIARAHYEGAIHLHDLGFIIRPYCGGHSLELSLIHISEPTRLRRISYAVFCLKKKKRHARRPVDTRRGLIP